MFERITLTYHASEYRKSEHQGQLGESNLVLHPREVGRINITQAFVIFDETFAHPVLKNSPNMLSSFVHLSSKRNT